MKKTQLLFYCTFLVLVSSLIYSCKEDVKADKVDPVLQELGGDYYQDLIRTPVNEDGSIDTMNMPRIVFDSPIHNFGNLSQMEKREHIFSFKNTGTKDLILLNVKTSCGCTIASYDEEPIAPGKKGEIRLNYDPKGRSGVQEKKIVVSANTFPNQTELTIIANIEKN